MTASSCPKPIVTSVTRLAVMAYPALLRPSFRLCRFASQIATRFAEKPHRFRHAEHQRICGDGVADRHFEKVGQGRHKAWQVLARKVMAGIELDTSLLRRSAGFEHFAEFALHRLPLERTAIGPGINFNPVGA